MNEREFAVQLERMDAPQFAALVAQPDDAQDRALRNYFGPDAYGRIRALAQAGATRAAAKGNVVVLHGIMGGELTYYGTPADPDHVWLSIPRMIAGRFDTLPLNPAGASIRQVEATGILKRYYGEQMLELMKRGWRVRAFWYDWRLDVDTSARVLAHRITEWFGNEPVHLVAHSMGGLVGRAFIRLHPEQWKAMWDKEGGGAAGGRLVMLGTPNHGSLAIPQLLFGLNGSIRKLALLDLRHSVQDLLEIVMTFLGTYQMLPDPAVMPDMRKLYDAATYPHLAIEQSRLDRALAFHDELAPVRDPDRMTYIAGYDQATYTAIRDWSRITSLDGYEVSRLGDGTVPHRLGLLEGIPTWYAKAEHSALTCDEAVHTAVDEVLVTGRCTGLPATLPEGVRGEVADPAASKELALRNELEEAATLELAAPLKAATRYAERDSQYLSETERQLESLVLRGFLATGAIAQAPRRASAAITASAMGMAASAGAIRIRFVRGGIQDAGEGAPADGAVSIDAVSVGHYIGVRPVAAELALDKAISAPETETLLLTQFTERGVLRGEIGQPFFLDDPRTRNGAARRRIIAVAGMGYPGRFGVPELVVLTRELVWSLGQLGKRSLATVLIGSGEGNLAIRDAACGWLEGIKRGLQQSGEKRLETITIVEFSPGRLLQIQRAFQAEAAKPGVGLQATLDLTPEPELIEAAQAEAEARARAAVTAPETWDDQVLSEHATRFTVELEGNIYRYGAITQSASVPERRILLDPDLVVEANDALAASADALDQGKLGQYLLKLLVPADLRQELASAHPLVITCDSTAARIHWEMVSQPDRTALAGTGEATFLGIHRGLTRQLRTQFAPPPDPAPPAARILRVLIVADPSKTDPLPGAEAEGRLVCSLFEQFRRQEMDQPKEMRRVAEVEIVALLGPADATRTRVMQELLLQPYDILHYAGHCMFDNNDPAASGWIFTGGKRLSANELSRVDRIPRFVFSNACESGITPDRSGERSAALAPGFAEAFFARGVQDFICTGWPVNDRAALDFAETFYSCVLGLDGRPPLPVHAALREARIRVFTQQHGRKTWGAYQHYGNPYSMLVASAPAASGRRLRRAAGV